MEERVASQVALEERGVQFLEAQLEAFRIEARERRGAWSAEELRQAAEFAQEFIQAIAAHGGAFRVREGEAMSEIIRLQQALIERGETSPPATGRRPPRDQPRSRSRRAARLQGRAAAAGYPATRPTVETNRREDRTTDAGRVATTDEPPAVDLDTLGAGAVAMEPLLGRLGAFVERLKEQNPEVEDGGRVAVAIEPLAANANAPGSGAVAMERQLRRLEGLIGTLETMGLSLGEE